MTEMQSRKRWGAVLLAMGLAGAAHGAQRSCDYVVQSGQQYATGLLEHGVSQPLYIDAYLPVQCQDGPVGHAQPVMLIAGGGFNTIQRDGEQMVEIADGLARDGFAVFAIDHRLRLWHGLRAVSETKSPAELDAYYRRVISNKSPYGGDQHFQTLIAMEDGYKAISWIRSRAVDYSLDVQSFGLLGTSSGASTVLSLEYGGDDTGFAPLRSKAVVDLWGDLYPHAYLERAESPLLVVAGTADRVIKYEQTTDLMGRASQVGLDATRITMPGVSHGLDDADIMHRMVVGTDLTIYEAVLRFLEATLRGVTLPAWPPEGQTREMVAQMP